MLKNVLIYSILLVMLLALVVAGYYFFGAKNSPLRGAEVAVGAKIFRVEVASSTLERARGLSGRDGLAENSGMFFIFNAQSDYGFWMKDMKFPIDIIWIKDGTVRGVSENAVPEPEKPVWGLKIYHPPEPVDRVLEVNTGDVKKYGIKVGDSVSVSGF